MSDADTSPSPFRRFPWVQLAFCIACLAMTAWTWMRYSYAWEMLPNEWPGLDALPHPALEEVVGDTHAEALVDEYVRVEGSVRHCSPVVATCNSGGRQWQEHMGYEVRLAHEGRAIQIWYPLTSDAPTEGGAEMVVHGRVEANEWDWFLGETTRVNANASRFHPASVAGIVVGAMGVFVFGLYLRRWVKERRAGESA